ncbi:MAG: hypothetical protein KJO41_01425 [Bacteroidia bacterium]|nr:hypothetical protein [Bacteroidia bacterium]MBT8277632.1 hypothetical protein [Bacteroidia bacterium]NNK60903.1 hypothetical protein [Flavobacteriaceae bacterium]RZW55401.1 MAG: hypothetical protein EX263_04715 [Flavobacteriaceae bacterium]
MYDALKNLHSYWAYFVLLMLIVAVVNAIIGRTSKKEYTQQAFRIALFTLIVAHMQLLIGLILYFVSPMFDLWDSLGGEVMKDSLARLYLVEHPLTNIIAIVLITIGFSKAKKKFESASKYKTILIFYSIALILLLSRIPWDAWPR